MQLFSIICPLAAVAGLVSAVMIPADPEMIGRIANPLEYSSREGKVVKRAEPGEPGFYFCNQVDYKGDCFEDQSVFGTCVTVQDDFIGVPDEFGSSISSVKVNDHTHCVLYRDARCEGTNKILLFSGEHDLFFKDFKNDMVSSFRCDEL